MTLARRLEAGAFVAASMTLSALPRAWTIGFARACGPLLAKLMPRRRRVAEENLACTELGADLDAEARRRLAGESLGHSLALAMDVLTLPRVAKAVEQHCELGEGSREVLQKAHAEGKGILLVASHFGLMESMGMLLGQVLGEIGQRLSFVAKPFPNESLDAAISRRRGATGNRTIHKGGAKASLLEVLGRGETAAIVLDQHVAPWARVWVPFFGLPAATARTLGTVAVQTGAPVVLIHSFPLPGGRCRVECGPLLHAPAGLESEESALSLLGEVVKAQEEAVRREPAAWNWIHRRWKVRRDDARERYPAYSITESEEAERIARKEQRESA